MPICYNRHSLRSEKSLQDLKIPEGVTEIENEAYWMDKKLEVLPFLTVCFT